jgi:hypothetical protein
LSVLYTPLLRKAESEEISLFHSFWGKESRTYNSTEKDNTFLHESHREREERIKEREREKVNTHKTSFTKNPTNPNMINPVKERE